MENDSQLKKEKWSWLNHKPDNMININCSEEDNFFKWWCIIMTPIIKLTPREIDLMACLLKQRFELSKKIPDSTLIDSLLMNHDTRQKILDECKISLEHFYVLMSNLRNKGIITESGIRSELIPQISKDNNGYCQLLFLFKDSFIK